MTQFEMFLVSFGEPWEDWVPQAHSLVSGKSDARLLKRHHCVRAWVCCFSGPFRKKMMECLPHELQGRFQKTQGRLWTHSLASTLWKLSVVLTEGGL